MIEIGNPYICHMNNKSRVYCKIKIDEDERNIWFEVNQEYEKYLVTECVDAYVIGMLNFAMRENHSIISQCPITGELLYNINTILIPTLTKYGHSLYRIEVKAPIGNTLVQGQAVGTGCSCGVDSLSTIYNHYNTKYPSEKLTHLCINNVGAFGLGYEDFGKEKTRMERYRKAKEVANLLGMELIETNSNFAEEVPQNHYLTNTYSSCFAIYSMQKLWKKYYYSSVGIDFSEFTVVDNDLEDSSHYDLLTLQCFSTEGIRIWTEGGEKTRLEKTLEISNFGIAQKYLHVCTSKPYNCNICPKCRRTLVTLDLINNLECFREVFDIDYYLNHRVEYYEWLYFQHKEGNCMNEPVYQEFLKRAEFLDIVNFYENKHR